MSQGKSKLLRVGVDHSGVDSGLDLTRLLDAKTAGNGSEVECKRR